MFSSYIILASLLPAIEAYVVAAYVRPRAEAMATIRMQYDDYFGAANEYDEALERAKMLGCFDKKFGWEDQEDDEDDPTTTKDMVDITRSVLKDIKKNSTSTTSSGGSDPLSTRAKLQEQRAPEGGAAQAAASWGQWRNKAPTNAKVRAHHILVDNQEKALSLLKQLTFGAEIADLAAEHSLCPSKDEGGDLGVFKPGDMVEEFDTFVFDDSSPVGVPLGPVETPFGYHVIVIDERTSGE